MCVPFKDVEVSPIDLELDELPLQRRRRWKASINRVFIQIAAARAAKDLFVDLVPSRSETPPPRSPCWTMAPAGRGIRLEAMEPLQGLIAIKRMKDPITPPPGLAQIKKTPVDFRVAHGTSSKSSNIFQGEGNYMTTWNYTVLRCTKY